MQPAMLIAVLGLAALAACHAQSLVNTTNLRAYGFTYGSNINGYINMTLDTCAIKAAIDAGNLTAAWQIINFGQNSYTSNALTTPRRFVTWVNNSSPGEQTNDMLNAYNGNDTTWLYKKVKAAYDGGNGALLYGLISVVTAFKYCMHEFDAAWGNTVRTNTLTNVATGAPHAVDEAWAIYAAGHPNECGETPRSKANRLAREVNVRNFGLSPTVLHATLAMNDAWYAATLGNTSQGVKLITDARASMHTQWAVYHAQGIVREAYAAELYHKCQQTAWVAKSWALAEAYWTALAPYLSLRKVRASTLAAVDSVLAAPTPSYRQVRRAVDAAVSAISIEAGKLGLPQFAYINQVAACKASSHAPKL